MSIEDEYEVLSQLKLFDKLDSKQLKRLLFASERYQIQAGEYLFRQGDPADHVFAILTGELSILISTETGESEIAIRSAGELVGEMATITGESRTASIRGKVDSEVIGIDSKLFLDTIINDPQTALQMMQVLSERLTELSQQQIAATKHL